MSCQSCAFSSRQQSGAQTKKFPGTGPSIAEVKTFITNRRRCLIVTYAKAAAPARDAQQQASVADKSAASASQKETKATPTQTVKANKTAKTTSVGKTNQGKVPSTNGQATATTCKGSGTAPIAATNTNAKAQGKTAKGNENRDNNQKLASILKNSVEKAQTFLGTGKQTTQRESRPTETKSHKQARSNSKSRANPKRNRESEVEEILAKFVDGLTAGKSAPHKQKQTPPAARSQSQTQVKFAGKSKTNVVEQVNLHDGTMLVIIGDSPLAIEVAYKLDATLLPSIVNESALDDLRSVVDKTEDHVKVAFMDYGNDESFHTRTPEEIKERLNIAGDIVGKNCTSKSHTKKC